MEIVKWILVIAAVGFCIWQVYDLIKEIIERKKNKKAKQMKAEAVATKEVDKKESN